MAGPGIALRIEGSSFGRVRRGMDVLPAAMIAAGRLQWERAGEEMLDVSQQVVHVITGRLKRSGRLEMEIDGPVISANVVYGGGEVDYALYEHARGGDHAYLDRAYGAVVDGLPEILQDTWQATVGPVLFGGR